VRFQEALVSITALSVVTHAVPVVAITFKASFSIFACVSIIVLVLATIVRLATLINIIAFNRPISYCFILFVSRKTSANVRVYSIISATKVSGVVRISAGGVVLESSGTIINIHTRSIGITLKSVFAHALESGLVDWWKNVIALLVIALANVCSWTSTFHAFIIINALCSVIGWHRIASTIIWSVIVDTLALERIVRLSTTAVHALAGALIFVHAIVLLVVQLVTSGALARVGAMRVFANVWRAAPVWEISAFVYIRAQFSIA
jgi:hypothetical protein